MRDLLSILNLASVKTNFLVVRMPTGALFNKRDLLFALSACPQGPFFEWQVTFLRCQHARRIFFVMKNYVFVLLACPQGLFCHEKLFSALSACPQGPFCGEKCIFCVVSMPAGAFLWWKIHFLRCQRARKGLFVLKTCIFALSACPQLFFFYEKLCFCAVSMPAGASFW